MSEDPVHRKYHHHEIDLRPALRLLRELRPAAVATTRSCTARARCSAKMPGDGWQKFANLRAYYGFMWAIRARSSCSWAASSARGANGTTTRASTGTCSTIAWHRGVQLLVRDLNRLYRELQALHERDCEADGFEWLELHDNEQSVVAFLRRGADPDRIVVVVSQLHAGAALRLPDRGAAARPLPRAAQHRCRASTAAPTSAMAAA